MAAGKISVSHQPITLSRLALQWTALWFELKVWRDIQSGGWQKKNGFVKVKYSIASDPIVLRELHAKNHSPMKIL